MDDTFKNLWLSVVKAAVEDYRGGNGPILHKDAESWLISNNEGVGSFIWVCEVLDIEPSYIRRICNMKKPYRMAENTLSI